MAVDISLDYIGLPVKQSVQLSWVVRKQVVTRCKRTKEIKKEINSGQHGAFTKPASRTFYV